MDREQIIDKHEMGLVSKEDLPELFRILVLQSPISTWIADKSGTLIFQNDACRRLFGIERDEEVVGKYNIFKDEVLSARGVMPQIRRVFDEGVATEVIVDYDFSQVTHVEVSHPTHRILRGFLFPIKDDEGRVRYVVVQHEDYTRRWHAEKSLAESQARYKELVEDVSDWVWEVDLEGRFTYSSPVVERILGYRTDEVIGKSAFEFIIPEDRLRAMRVFEKAADEKREIAGLLTRIRRKDGSVCYLETSGKPVFDGQGALIGYRGIDRDVTERELAEQRRRELDERSREFYRRTILAATEGKLVICEREEIQKILSPPAACWNIRHAEELSGIRHAIADVARSAGMDEARIMNLVLALGEASTNALKHAGGGTISAHEKPGSLMFAVADEGPGIDTLVLPEATLKWGYSTAGSLGMGYKAIISIADKVYLATGPTGTTVAVEMKLKPEKESIDIDKLPDTWRDSKF